jgi:hypothetical protein
VEIVSKVLLCRFLRRFTALSRRHRVRETCSANGRFCPIIRRTRTLTGFLEQDLAARARDRRPHRRRASFEFEGERPPRNRLER